jgi:hypothetical protein
MQFSVIEKCMTTNVYISDIHFTLMRLQVCAFGSVCMLKCFIAVKQSCCHCVHACVLSGNAHTHGSTCPHIHTHTHLYEYVINILFFGG